MSDMPAGFATMSRAIEGAGNYYDWMHGVLRGLLGRSILEIGPGFGALARRILAEGKAYRAIDMDAPVIENLRAALALSEDHLVVGDVTEPRWIEYFGKLGVDTVLSANVLEHIKDERPILEAAARLAPGGRFVILVPALPALYGSLDEEAGHYRRYSRDALAALLKRSGFEISHLSYFNAVGAAAWFISARILRLALNAEETNGSIALYDRAVIPMSKLIDPCLRGLGGQSLIAAGRLPA